MSSKAKDLIADTILYAILLVAGAFGGMQFEAASQAHADKAELQDLQRRAAANAAWLRGERVASESRLNKEIADLYAQLGKDQGEADEQHQTHVAGVRAGTVSVRVPVVPASCPGNSVRATSGATPEAAKTYAQLDPAAAADLAAIPHEGDAAIRELNLCIDAYNTLSVELQQWRQTLVRMDNGYAQTR